MNSYSSFTHTLTIRGSICRSQSATSQRNRSTLFSSVASPNQFHDCFEFSPAEGRDPCNALAVSLTLLMRDVQIGGNRPTQSVYSVCSDVSSISEIHPPHERST